MNVIARPPVMSREQFLNWVQHQQGRFELENGRPIAMTGGSRRHNLIAGTVYVMLRARLRGTPHRVFIADVAIETGASSLRYPDVMVTASPDAGSELVVDDAIVVFDVVSPTSGRNDRSTTMREYLRVPSIRRYVIVEQTSAALTVLERDDSGAAWRASAVVAGETLDLPELGVSLPMGEIYEGVDLPDEPIASEPVA